MTAGLEGSRIIVTGATGMAAAGAMRFAAEGASVFVVSLDPDECRNLTSAVTAAGGRGGFAAADLRNEAATEEAFGAAADFLGGIDGLFAVAGSSGRRFGDGLVHEIPAPGWEETMTRNATPAFLAAREAVKAMLGTGAGGSVVLVSSVLATSPSPERFGTHAYTAAKGAIEALTVTMAAAYAPQGLRVNAIAPGLVDTPMATRAASDPDAVAYAARKQPLVAGLLPADSVAGTAAFLLSDDAAYVTGQVISVDGGWSVTSTGP